MSNPPQQIRKLEDLIHSWRNAADNATGVQFDPDRSTITVQSSTAKPKTGGLELLLEDLIETFSEECT